MATWLGAQPEFQCPDWTCDFLQAEVEWWCPGWICDIPIGVVRRFNPYPYIFHGRAGMTRGPRQTT